MRARPCFSATRRERRGLLRPERAGPAHIHIEAVQGRGQLDIERLFQGRQRFGDRPGGCDCSGHGGRQHRAGVDRHQRMCAQGGKSDLEDLVRGSPRVQHRAPASFAMRVDQRVDVRIDPRLRKRRHHEIAFPCAIGRLRPMLDGAAAANPEMRTKRDDAVGRGRIDA
jgi:hypothetical protein